MKQASKVKAPARQYASNQNPSQLVEGLPSGRTLQGTNQSLKGTYKHVPIRDSGRRPINLRKNNYVTQQMSAKAKVKPSLPHDDEPSHGNGLSELAGITGLTGLSGIVSNLENDRSELTSMPTQQTGSHLPTTMMKFDDSNFEASRQIQQTATTHHHQQV